MLLRLASQNIQKPVRRKVPLNKSATAIALRAYKMQANMHACRYLGADTQL